MTKHKIKELAGAVLASIFCMSFQNKIHAETVTIVGTGTLSCGVYSEAYHEKNERQLDLVVQWVWGLMAGYNFWANPQINPPERDTVILSIESYCQKNPLKNLVQYSLQIIQELGGRKP